MFLIILTLCGGLASIERTSASKVGLISKEDLHFTDDQYIWPPRTDLHYTGQVPHSKRLRMYLRNVDIHDNGPTFGTTTTLALKFTGTTDSYATVFNNGTENTQAGDYFTWFMLLFAAQWDTGVFLEYSECFDPIRAELVGDGTVKLTMGDNLANVFTLTSRVIFGSTTREWKGVAIAYHKNQDEIKIIDFDRDGSNKESVLNVSPTERSLNGAGDTRIGASYDYRLSAFSGRMACIQFYRGFFLKNYDLSFDYCNPDFITSRSMVVEDVTVDEDPFNLISERFSCPYDLQPTTTTTFPTTTSTSSPTTATLTNITLPAATMSTTPSSFLTATAAALLGSATSASTTSSTNISNTEPSTTSTTLTATIPPALTSAPWQIFEDKCLTLKLAAEHVQVDTNSNFLDRKSTTNIKTCAHVCLINSACARIAFDDVTNDCILGEDSGLVTFPVSTTPSYKLFVLQ